MHLAAGSVQITTSAVASHYSLIVIVHNILVESGKCMQQLPGSGTLDQRGHDRLIVWDKVIL
jgi:hypothetical protein